MYDLDVRRQALAALRDARSLSAVSRELGINRSTLREWRDKPEWATRGDIRAACFRCSVPPSAPPDTDAYRYLLGLYLGDGCISRSQRVWVLRISCDDSWPGLQDECARAIRAVSPNKVARVPAPGCHSIQAYSKHWPCVFPQHGVGRKHERLITLIDWQTDLVQADPRPFLRGLFHSDGCRITNRTVRQLRDGPKRYEYGRYFFSNESSDILALCAWALDLMEIPWRLPRPNTISVARREGVEALDGFVGPKY